MKIKYFGLAVAFFVLLTTAFSVSAQSEGASPINNALLLKLINQQRSANHLQALAENQKLNLAAKLKLDDMVANNYFEHTSPQGKSPWYFFQKSGYSYQSAAENLAMNFNDSEKLEKAWIQSKEHRDNILNPDFAEVGIAQKEVMFNGQPTNFIVEFFSNPQSPAEMQVRN